MKSCSKCKREKSIDEFYRNGKSRDGRASQCKICTDETGREYAKIHREELSAQALKRYYKNPEKHLEKTRRYLYGLEPEDFEQLRLNQGDKCAICKEKFLGKPSVDHCHKTGKIRGLLCRDCNTGLGQFDDSPERLLDAANYLDNMVST